MSNDENERFKVEKGVPLTLLFMLISSLVSGVWFAAKTTSKIEWLDVKVDDYTKLIPYMIEKEVEKHFRKQSKLDKEPSKSVYKTGSVE